MRRMAGFTEECMAGAREVHGRCMGGAWEVHGRLHERYMMRNCMVVA